MTFHVFYFEYVHNESHTIFPYEADPTLKIAKVASFLYPMIYIQLLMVQLLFSCKFSEQL